MERVISSLLESLPLPEGARVVVSVVAAFAALSILALLLGLVARRIAEILLRKAVRKTVVHWDDIAFEAGVFRHAASTVPPIIILALLPAFVTEPAPVAEMARRLASAWLIAAVVRVLSSVLVAINEVYRHRDPEAAQRKPIKGYLQMVKIFVFGIGGILMLTSIMDVSPAGILGGFGAMSAVLMLVFQDSIKGFAASIQLTANDMVRIGDWVEMPKYGADGEVIDLTLQTAKIRNWDMTITSMPISALTSDSFKNWRGMSESEGRRAKKVLYLDMNAVRFLSAEETVRLSRLPLLSGYMEQKKAEIEEYNRSHGIDPEDRVSARGLTNLGTFRAYVEAYLKAHPMISKKLTLMARYLEATPKGLPMELYMFSSDKNWVTYEGIMADIMDHLLSVMGEFGLRPFQDPAGWDWRSAAR